MRQVPDLLQEIIVRLKGKVNWKSLVITLSAIVVFVTTYLLILPAITIDKKAAIEQGGIDVAIEQTIDETGEQAAGTEDADAVEADDAADAADEAVVTEEPAPEPIAQEGSAQTKKASPDPGEVKLLNTTKELTADVDESAPNGVNEVVMERKVFKNGVEVQLAKYSFVNGYKATGPGKPNTGDNTNIFIPIAIFAAAVIALLAMLIKRRKNKDDDK